VKSVLQEGALVAVIGAVLAFAAHALSPYRFDLGKDHFPATSQASTSPATSSNVTAAAASSTNSPQELLAALLRANGLQLADSNQVTQYFRDPRREQDGIIFIDARNDDHYRAGHIPGAYQFDHFRPENYLTNVLQVCLTAEQIVFYCNGGECDDSIQAAVMLRDSVPIPKEKLFIYGGGITEWATNGFPVELGARNSGRFTNLVSTAVRPNP
jgi:rhodanese-related sulfurtransferase